MAATAATVSDYMRLLSAPGRLMILCQLAEGERAAGDLAEAAGLKAPALSQHLARLRSEGAVAARREGRSIHYAIADPTVLTIMQFLYDTFCSGDPQPREDGR